MANTPPTKRNVYTVEDLAKLPMFDRNLIKKAREKHERKRKRELKKLQDEGQKFDAEAVCGNTGA